jgi:hypothetical protein
VNTELWTTIGLLLGTGLGAGVLKGATAFLDGRRRRRAASDPPPTERQLAAREAGFKPGETGRFEAVNSLGDMRCNGHAGIEQELHTLSAAASSAASAASVASASATRTEQAVHDEGETTRAALKEFGAKFEKMAEWKGDVGARLHAVERDVSRLTVARGGSAVR